MDVFFDSLGIVVTCAASFGSLLRFVFVFSPTQTGGTTGAASALVPGLPRARMESVFDSRGKRTSRSMILLSINHNLPQGKCRRSLKQSPGRLTT